MTIRLYARRKGIPLGDVACDAMHEKCHAEDCDECDKSERKFDLFRRDIRMEGNLTDDHRTALLAIADKCPVHRTLHGRALMETELAWLGR